MESPAEMLSSGSMASLGSLNYSPSPLPKTSDSLSVLEGADIFGEEIFGEEYDMCAYHVARERHDELLRKRRQIRQVLRIQEGGYSPTRRRKRCKLALRLETQLKTVVENVRRISSFVVTRMSDVRRSSRSDGRRAIKQCRSWESCDGD